MAGYIANDEIAELNDLGVTTAEVELRMGGSIYIDGPDVYVLGREGQYALQRLIAEAQQRQARRRRHDALATGQRVEWRKIAGAWVLAGRNLHTGDIVTVTRRDGTASTEIVGAIIGEHDGLTLAHPGHL